MLPNGELEGCDSVTKKLSFFMSSEARRVGTFCIHVIQRKNRSNTISYIGLLMVFVLMLSQHKELVVP